MSFGTSPSGMSVPPSPNDADAEYAPQLEKDYCSNFVCCGLALADLHELVGHFEETHVTVVAPDGAPLPPASPDSPTDPSSPQTASSSALESPRSAFASTPPPPNIFPTLTSAFQPRESAFEPVTTSSSRDPCLYGDSYNCGVPSLHLAKEEQYVFDTMLRSDAYDCNTATAMQAPLGSHSQSQICLPPAQLSPIHYPSSVTPHYTTSYANQKSYTPAYTLPPTLAPIPVYARPPTLSIITETQPTEHSKPVKKRKGENASWVSASETEDSLPPRRKKAPANKLPSREKAHKCPHAGCVKSYMNPNGLKYHVTKGVCDFGE